TRKSEVPPIAVPFFPVEWRLPALLVHGRPPEGQPEFRPAISIVFNETQILAASDRSRCEREWLNQCTMLRAFVVVRETGAAVPDGCDRFSKIDKTHRWRRRGFFRCSFAENGMQRVLGENVLDIGEEQFLVLRFGLIAEDHDRL